MTRAKLKKNINYKPLRKTTKESWFKKNIIGNLQAISTLLLVVVTGFYVYLTWDLSKSSQEQIRLNTDPQISIYSDLRPIYLLMKDSTLEFTIKNYSRSTLLDISLHMRFYIHYIDSLGGEKFIECSTGQFFDIEKFIFRFEERSLYTYKIDFKPYISVLSKESGYFYLTDTFNGQGHWERLNLRRNYKQMFSIFKFTYYRGDDGKKFSSLQYFQVDGFPLFVDRVLFTTKQNLDEIIFSHRRFVRSVIERDDSPLNDPDYFNRIKNE